MNRKQRRALGRSGTKPASGLAETAASGATSAAALAELVVAAVAQHQTGALNEAERRYRHILTLFPDHAETHSRLGAVLMAQNRPNEAIAQIEQALALKPDLFEGYGNLAQAYMAMGQSELAIQALSRALDINETAQVKTLLATYLEDTRFTADRDGKFRKLALRALLEGWARPRELTGACISLIRLNPVVNECIARANAAWPARLPAAELFGKSGAAALSADKLLCRLLECDPLTDIGLERFLTDARAAMLTIASDNAESVGAPELEFYAALARQCFINDYVPALADNEAKRARELTSALAVKIDAEEYVPVLWPIAVAAYCPLHAVPNVETLRSRSGSESWPVCVEALFIQQITEPTEERRLATAIPVLAGIDGEVSRAVRQQYEESPYPRWVKTGASTHAGPATPDDTAPAPAPAVLIAGCGTGLSTIELARQIPHARILAIDLSLASLGYAKRMAQELGLDDIEFTQADIMKLDSIGREFDFIDASGVLHHLADPWEGWRILLSLLRPGGTMQVGLYSDLARRNVVAARALIAQRGYRPVAEDIRRCREDIIAAEEPLLKSLMNGPDFFTMSECRDLLFHVQEHRITLPEIKSFVTAENLIFTGFILDAATLRRFAARFPGRTAPNDLDRWHAFEAEAPNTFAGMYRFQVRKPPKPL
jgi:SAM-dependent methyltransferase